TRHDLGQQAAHKYISMPARPLCHNQHQENIGVNIENRPPLPPAPTNGARHQNNLPSIRKLSSHLPRAPLWTPHRYDGHTSSLSPAKHYRPELQLLRSVATLLRYHVHKILYHSLPAIF